MNGVSVTASCTAGLVTPETSPGATPTSPNHSDTSSIPSSISPSSSMYRRSVHTIIQPVDPANISFEPSSGPGTHPYEDPILQISNPQDRAALEDAAGLLKSGECVAFPTETVYGVGADATSTKGVRSIYAAKSRPADNPLIVHVASLKMLRRLLPAPSSATQIPNPEKQIQGQIPEVYLPLIEKFWPGPLTILLPLPSPSPLSPNVTSTQPTFAARMPRHPIALALATISDLPLAAPSANASGKPSPTTANHVHTDLQGRIQLIIDGGSADVGLESTVVDGLRNPPVVLRPGGVSVEELKACGGIWENIVVAKRDEDTGENTVPRAPGMKYKHYSPRAGVILYEVGAHRPTVKDLLASHRFRWRIGVIRTRTWPEGFAQEEIRKHGGDFSHDTNAVEIFEENLGTTGKDIGRRLFRILRELDERGVDVMHIEGIDETDEGLAVMNRLGKAASVVVRKVDG